MRAATLLLLALSAALTTTGAPAADSPDHRLPQPDIYTQLQQAESRLAQTLDNKEYDKLHLSFTPDILYDNSQFLTQGRPGGVAKGFDAVVAATKAQFGDALVRHDVTTYTTELLSLTRARLVTYLIFSRWDPTALKDDSKTFRVWERCDDIWVLQEGLWKLQNSTVVDMGPNWELPDVRVPAQK